MVFIIIQSIIISHYSIFPPPLHHLFLNHLTPLNYYHYSHNLSIIFAIVTIVTIHIVSISSFKIQKMSYDF